MPASATCAFQPQSLDPKQRRWHLNAGRFKSNAGASSAGRKSRLWGRRNAQPQIPFPANGYVRIPVSGNRLRTYNPREFETALRDFLYG